MGASADTIFAVASGVGRAAVAVLRISGPRTGALLDLLGGQRPAPRTAGLRTLRDPTGEVLDRALMLWFPQPASYTGEDCGELQLHGGGAVLDGVVNALASLGARPAEPGEFTRRAFLNGRMDLIEAEAVADLVDAETSAQRRQALRQLGGELGARYRAWASRLTQLLARQEALIDFPDEDLPPDLEAAALSELAALRLEIEAHLDDGRRGERLRDGLVFAIVGAPNVGKSTLLNALAGRDAAIVSPTAGTTRDVLEIRIVIEGVPVTLLDTAGLRDTLDPVEAEGVRRARARAGAADLLLIVRDTERGPHAADIVGDFARVVVCNKADLGHSMCDADVQVSALTGEGMERLLQVLADNVRKMTAHHGPPALTRARHRVALTQATRCLGLAMAAPLAELRGEELRAAVLALGKVTGRVDTEAVLDVVFGQFCIGK